MDIRRNAIKVAAVGLLAAAGGLALGADRFVSLAGHLEDAVDPEREGAAGDSATGDADTAAGAHPEGDPDGRPDAGHAGS
jgi:hypothetical protein